MEVASAKRGETATTTTTLKVLPESDDYVSEDEHLHSLETSGEMQQVIGSQSLLSQEIHRMEDDKPQSQPVFSQDVNAFSQVSVQSTENFDSQELAHQYGLLSQDPAARATVRTHRAELDSQNMVFDNSQGSSRSSQGGFGTLLDAVSMFQSQEEEEERVKKRRKAESDSGTSDNGRGGQSSFDEEDARRNSSNSKKATRQSTRISNRASKGKSSHTVISTDSATTVPTNNNTRRNCSNSQSQQPKPFPLTKNNSTNIIIHDTPMMITTAPTKQPILTAAGAKKRKRKDDTEQIKQQHLARRAADLAQRTINDPELAKRLLLSMALTRENPRSAPETLPGPGHVLPEGFFWAHYPPLEKVLKDNMAEYYELSITKCQSAQQQSFNNTLVELVRSESNQQGWLYAPCFTDKNLRDRIRCYYKTHIQNAKKRLRTMVKNPTKRANARHLCSHLDMIENNVALNATPTAQVDPETNEVITHQDWGATYAGAPVRDAAVAMVSNGNDRAATFEARVAASVAVATKSIHDEVKAKNARIGHLRPDGVGSNDIMPMEAGSMPLAGTLAAAAALAPDAVPVRAPMPALLAAASAVRPMADLDNELEQMPELEKAMPDLPKHESIPLSPEAKRLRDTVNGEDPIAAAEAALLSMQREKLKESSKTAPKPAQVLAPRPTTAPAPGSTTVAPATVPAPAPIAPARVPAAVSTVAPVSVAAAAPVPVSGPAQMSTTAPVPAQTSTTAPAPAQVPAQVNAEVPPEPPAHVPALAPVPTTAPVPPQVPAPVSTAPPTFNTAPVPPPQPPGPPLSPFGSGQASYVPPPPGSPPPPAYGAAPSSYTVPEDASPAKSIESEAMSTASSVMFV